MALVVNGLNILLLRYVSKSIMLIAHLKYYYCIKISTFVISFKQNFTKIHQKDIVLFLKKFSWEHVPEPFDYMRKRN